MTMGPTRWQIRNSLMPSSSLCPTTVTWVGFCPRCSLLPEHRREREGWGGTMLGLRMYPKMAKGTRASNSRKMSLIGNFLWIISVQVWNLKHCCYDFTKGLEWEEDGKMSRAHCGLSSIPLKPTLLVWNVFYSLTEEEHVTLKSLFFKIRACWSGAQPIGVQSEPETSSLHSVPSGLAGNTTAAQQRA